MVGQERSVNGIGSGNQLELIVPVLHSLGVCGACLGLDGVGNKTRGIGKCKIEEAVKAAVEILQNRAGAGPCFTDRVEGWIFGLAVIGNLFEYLGVSDGIVEVEIQHSVKAETVNTLADPEIADFVDFFPDIFAVVVELRHIVAEVALVVASGASRNLLVSLAVAFVIRIAARRDGMTVLLHLFGGDIAVIFGVFGIELAFSAVLAAADQFTERLEPLVLL